MSNLDNKNKNFLVENIIVYFLFIVILVFKSLKTLSRIFTYGILKKEILTNKTVNKKKTIMFSTRRFLLSKLLIKVLNQLFSSLFAYGPKN